MYPLCIDISDLELVEISSFDASFGMIESDRMISYYVPEEHVLNVICDSTNTNMKVKQMYKYKVILVDVMGKYKMDRGFNFRVKRSGWKWY